MIVFFGFLLLIIRRISNKMNTDNEILVLIFYFFSFFAFVVLFSKTYSFRYIVPALIVFQIISGIGIYEFANIFIKRNNIVDKKLIYSWMVIFILISQGLLIYYSEIERIENLPYFGWWWWNYECFIFDLRCDNLNNLLHRNFNIYYCDGHLSYFAV